MHMKKIGILGGTFNPIHMGHLLLGEYVKDELDLQEIWFLPTGQSYMKAKNNVLSANERLNMVELAVSNNSSFLCKDIEVKRNGNTYTYETLEYLHAEYSDHEFYFIVGTDCMYKIENWKSPERIFQNCILVVAAREGVSMDEMCHKRKELQQRFHAQIVLLPFMDIPISSTMLRERIALGKSVRYMIPDNVCNYIEEKGFYRE